MTRTSDSSVPRSASRHPPVGRFDLPIFHAETRHEWRNWLEHNHNAERGVWLCSWRSQTGPPRCPYPEVVEEAICFGWIDSTVTVFDDQRSLQLITPRKAKSSWTRLNRQRATDMETVGLMNDAGRHVIEIARGNGWWTIYDTVEDLVEPVELADALTAHPAARQTWEAFSPSTRKLMLWWVVSAAKDETRTRRIEAIGTKAAVGRRAKS